MACKLMETAPGPAGVPWCPRAVFRPDSMTFESAEFLLFLLVTLTAFWALERSRTAQKLLLIAASAWFYGSFRWDFAALLALSVVGNHALAGAVCRRTGRARRGWLAAAVAANAAPLAWFKYSGFFAETLNDASFALGLGAGLPIPQVVLPLGISFYTFQAIAYQIEVHRGTGPRAKSLVDFALFMAFFPQLLIGPICRGRELLPQIEARAPARVEKLPLAVSLILSGLFKRMVIASLLFDFGVADAFQSPENYTAAALWVALFGYTAQIYCDFSGYVDLMRGCALLFGIEIPDNFNNPYSAASVGDYWRRWHMTFSRWLRDFVYYPLGGSRRGRRRVLLNLFLTMVFCGLWHGATWGFILWGAVHGAALALYKFLLDRRRARGDDTARRPTALEWLRGWSWTMLVAGTSRVFFVCSDLATAWTYLARLCTPGLRGGGFSLLLPPLTLAGFALNFVGDAVRARFVRGSEALPLPLRWAFWLAMFFLLLAVRPVGVLPNAYFQF